MPSFAVIVSTTIFVIAFFCLGVSIGFKIGVSWGIDEMKRTLDARGFKITTAPPSRSKAGAHPAR